MMDRDVVFEGHHPQYTAFKLLNPAPESIAVLFLRFASDRVFQPSNAPLLLALGRFRKTSFSK
jgi:hypothetical protein